MAQQRKHPSNCENATHEKCECGHCAGTLHSWVDAIQMMNDTTSEALRDFERDANRRWRQHCDEYDSKRRKPSKANLKHKKAAVDSARANLVRRFRERAKRGGPQRIRGASTIPQDEPRVTDARESAAPQGPHEPGQQPAPEATGTATEPVGDLEFDPAATDRALANNTNEARQVEALGYLLKQVLKQVEEDVGSLRLETRKAMAEHFWCELLVQFVIIIEEANHLLGSVPDKVVDGITKFRSERRLSQVERSVIAASAKQVWKRITGALGLTAISDAKALLPVLRTLAFLMCKSPSRHTAVIEHCLDPLKTLLLHETKKRLRRVFSDLLPQITTDLGGDDSLTSPG